MKKAILSFILIINYFPCYSQDVIGYQGFEPNGTFEQIRTSGLENMMIFQTLNQDIGNFVISRQTGDMNKIGLIQKNDESSFINNQSYTLQAGNSNDISCEQIGSGNLLLGIQIGPMDILTENQIGVQNNIFLSSGLFTGETENLAFGNDNRLSLLQQGNNNAVLANQEGSSNIISAEQTGNDNYLLVLQKGNYNLLTGYIQGNESEKKLYESVVQIGDNLSLTAFDVSKSKLNGNIFSQSGSNLTLEVNNGFLNSIGGIEVNQTGVDMKVVIDQSYFP